MARSKAAEANRLYWESDVSVAEIAQVTRRLLEQIGATADVDAKAQRRKESMTY